VHIKEGENPESFKITRKWLRDHNSQHVTNNFSPVQLLAYDGERLAGSLDGEFICGKLHVDNLVTHPDFRQQGIGRKLMQQAEEIAAKNNCTGIYLDTTFFRQETFIYKRGH